MSFVKVIPPRCFAMLFCCAIAQQLAGFNDMCYIVSMKRISTKNLVWKEGKYYVAQSLTVDVSSFGSSKAEALRNLREAVSLYLEDARKKDIRKIERPELVTDAVQYV
jgi:predicted RNase H-like HicB family nuclease